MKRVFAAASLAAFAAGLWGCASAPPPPRPAPEPPPATEPAPPPASVDVSWLVTSKSVNVRETTSTKTPTVARLNKGARLTSFEEKDGWLHVKLADTRTGSPERAEMAKSELQSVTFQPPVKKCRVTGFTYVYTQTF